MHIDVNSYQLMLGYTYEILHINEATSPQNYWAETVLLGTWVKCHIFVLGSEMILKICFQFDHSRNRIKPLETANKLKLNVQVFVLKCRAARKLQLLPAFTSLPAQHEQQRQENSKGNIQLSFT